MKECKSCHLQQPNWEEKCTACGTTELEFVFPPVSSCCHADIIKIKNQESDSGTADIICRNCRRSCSEANFEKDVPTNPEGAQQNQKWETRRSRIVGPASCLLTLLAIAVLYFALTSFLRFFSSDTGQNCHDRVSSDYVSGQITDSQYISELNSKCGESN